MKKHTCHLDHHQRSRYVDWTKELSSNVARQPEGEVARQPEGEVARQAKFFQPTRPIPNPIRDRSEQFHKHTVAIQDDPEAYHEAKTINTKMRHFVKELRKTWSSKFQDYHVLL